MPLRVGLVAGEASGDTLGAGLIHALRRLAPDAEFFGCTGPRLRAAGVEALCYYCRVDPVGIKPVLATW